MSNMIDLTQLSLNVKVKSNKRELTEQYFVENYTKLQRKEIIANFQTMFSMTPAGASTYYQNFKKKYDTIIKAQQELMLNQSTEVIEESVELIEAVDVVSEEVIEELNEEEVIEELNLEIDHN